VIERHNNAPRRVRDVKISCLSALNDYPKNHPEAKKIKQQYDLLCLVDENEYIKHNIVKRSVKQND
jgi:hypothetical protein